MTYSELIRNPSEVLNPPQEKKNGGLLLWLWDHRWWIILALIVKLVLIALFRPQWLAKLGIHIARGGGEALGGVNPMGWV